MFSTSNTHPKNFGPTFSLEAETLQKVTTSRACLMIRPEQVMKSRRPGCRCGSPNSDLSLNGYERLQSLLSDYGVVDYHLGPGSASWV
jgi:hypothetical protein